MRLPRTARRAVRVKGKKGKAGSDGRSSLANPKLSRYRDATQGRMSNVQTMCGVSREVLETEESAGLTREMLSKFDSEQREKMMDAMSLRLDPLKEDDQSMAEGALTFRSMASNFTQCTNPSFERVLRAWSGNSQQQNSVLAVLAGLTQVIKEKGGNGRNVEYFALLMNALDSFLETGDVENIAASAFLLKLIIARIPPAVLRKEFSRVSRTLARVLSDQRGGASTAVPDSASVSTKSAEVRTHDASLTKATLACVGVLLRAQNWATWTGATTRAVFNCLMRFVTDSRAKIRKAAHLSVVSILKSGESKGTPHPAGGDAVRCLLPMITTAPANGESPKKMMWALSLLGSILPFISANAIQEACEKAILPLMAQPTQPLVRLHSIRALHGLFAGFPSEERLSADKNAKLLTALYEMRPPKNSEDVGTMKAWMTTARAGIFNLLRLGRHRLVAPHLARLFPLCMDVLSSPVPGMHAIAGHAALRLLDDVLKELLEQTEAKNESEDAGERLGAQDTQRLLLSLLNCTRSGLDFQFVSAWPQVLKLMAGIINVWGKASAVGERRFWETVEAGEFGKEISQCVRQLAAMRDERVESKTERETVGGENVEADLERILGVAVQALGMLKFLRIVPLHMKKARDDDELDLTRSWVIPLLLSHGASSKQKTSLQYFFEELRPLADHFHKQKDEATAELADVDRPSARIKLLDTLFLQIWQLLPVFCVNPKELHEESFVGKGCEKTPTIVRALFAIVRRLEEWKDLRRILVTSIRRLIACEKRISTESESCPKLMRKYSKNVLPVLFNLYVKTSLSPDGAATIDAIRSYAEIAPEELVLSLFVSARTKVEAETDELKAKAEMDLLIALAPFLPEADIRQALDSCLEQVQDSEKSPKAQKKAYRMLQVIVESGNSTAKRLINEQLLALMRVLSDAQEHGQELSLKPRLRILTVLLNRMKEKKTELNRGEVKEMTKRLLAEVQLSMRAANSEARKTARVLLTDLARCWHEVVQNRIVEDEEQLAMTLCEVQNLITSGVSNISISDTSENALHLSLVTLNALSSLLQNQPFRAVVTADHVRQLINYCAERLLCSPNQTLARLGLGAMKDIVSACTTNTLPLDAFMSALGAVTESHRHALRFDVKALLLKLFRRVGAPLMLELIPEYLRFPFVRMARTELRKSRRADRKKQLPEEEKDVEEDDQEEMEAEMTRSGMLPKLRQTQTLDELLEDSDIEEDKEVRRKGKKPKRKANEDELWLEEEPGEVLDLLGSKVASRIHTKAPVSSTASKRSRDTEFPISEDGRMIIGEGDDETPDSESENEIDTSRMIGKGAKTVRPWRRKVGKKESEEPGSKFRSSKALGDMKSGKGPDPYAYLKLRGVSKKDIAVLMKKKRGKGVLGKGKLVRSKRQ